MMRIIHFSNVGHGFTYIECAEGQFERGKESPLTFMKMFFKEYIEFLVIDITLWFQAINRLNFTILIQKQKLNLMNVPLLEGCTQYGHDFCSLVGWRLNWPDQSNQLTNRVRPTLSTDPEKRTRSNRALLAVVGLRPRKDRCGGI